MMKKIAVAIILMGTIIMSIPFAADLYGSYQQEKILASYEADERSIEYAQKNYKNLLEVFTQEIDSEEDIDSQQASTEEGKKEGGEQKKMPLGVLEIPKINARIPIVEGSDQESLRFAAGHIPGTAMPGSTGNAAVAAHRSFKYGKLFNRLNEVEKGNVIVIETPQKKLTYKVTDKFLVLPEDTSVLTSTDHTSLITLITCHPMKNPTHRLIVQAELVNP